MRRRPESGDSNSKTSSAGSAAGPTTLKPSSQAEDIRQVFAHYRGYHPQAMKNPNSNSKEWRAIKARLGEGYTVGDLCLAIDGCHRSPFHCGENERGTKYTSLELIVRNGSQVAKFAEIAEQHATKSTPNVITERTRRTLRAGRSWLDGRRQAREQQEETQG